MASTREKHLSALGVAKHADAPTIKKAFKKLALKHHPDRNPDNVAEATERFKVVNEAYTYLTSTAGRSAPPRRRRPAAAAGPDAYAAERRASGGGDEKRPRPEQPRPPPKPKAKTEDERDLERARRMHQAAKEREEQRRKREAADSAKDSEKDREQRREKRASKIWEEAQERERDATQREAAAEQRAQKKRDDAERDRRTRMQRLAAEARAREFARAAAAEEAVARKKAEEAQAAEAEQRERSAEQERRWDAALRASANAAEAELRAGSEAAKAHRARWRVDGVDDDDGMTEDDAAWWRENREAGDDLGAAERLYERTQAQLRRNRDARAAKEAAAAKGDDWSTADQDAFYAQCCDAAAAVLGKGGSRRDPASPAGEELDRLLRAFGKRKVGLTPTPDEVAADRPRPRARDAPRTFVAGADGAVRPARRSTFEREPQPYGGASSDREPQPYGQREPRPYGAAAPDREPRPSGGDREPRPYGSDAPATPRAGVAMPTYVRVVGVAATSLELEWAPGAGEAAWQLQWSKDGGLTWDAAPRTLEAPRCRKRNLPPDTLVIFRVRAVAGGDASAWATVEGRTALQRSSKAGTASAFAAAVADEIPGESPTKSEGDAADGVNDAFARAQSWAADQADREAWAPSEKWHELVEEDSGQKFFWNEATGETRWDADPGWALRVDGDGAEYYVPGRRRRSRRPSSSQADDGAAGGSRSSGRRSTAASSMRSRLNSSSARGAPST
ncbi:hypothetical protein JL722_3534 [Aureococcus anophagefferens]|nr:hypothetical protein JL722_3534 [Aureococcus anophagefferens]